MKKYILFFIVCLFFSFQESKAGLVSEILSYENPSAGTGLYVRLSGKTKTGIEWTAREAKEEDIPFYQELFLIPAVYETFTDGKPTPPELIEKNMRDRFLPQIARGNPNYIHLTIFSDSKPMGRVSLKEEAPGCIEVGYAYMPEVKGQGLGSSVTQEVTKLFHEIRRVGTGEGLDPEQYGNLIKACQCQGKPLEKVVATVFPSNVASWKILSRSGFQPEDVAPEDEKLRIDFSGKSCKEDLDRSKTMEKELMKLFSPESPYKAGTLYRCIDFDGNTCTFGLHPEYQCIRYYLKYQMSLKSKI